MRTLPNTRLFLNNETQQGAGRSPEEDADAQRVGRRKDALHDTISYVVYNDTETETKKNLRLHTSTILQVVSTDAFFSSGSILIPFSTI